MFCHSLLFRVVPRGLRGKKRLQTERHWSATPAFILSARCSLEDTHGTTTWPPSTMAVQPPPPSMWEDVSPSSGRGGGRGVLNAWHRTGRQPLQGLDDALNATLRLPHGGAGNPSSKAPECSQVMAYQAWVNLGPERQRRCDSGRVHERRDF